MSERKEFEQLTLKDWQAKGRELFGDDPKAWAFVCPMCDNVATGQDFLDAGGQPDSAPQMCIGRLHERKADSFEVDKGNGPCNYAGFGLFQFGQQPVEMPDGEVLRLFKFAHQEFAEAVAS